MKSSDTNTCESGSARVKIYPALFQVVWPVLIFIASLVAGYYRGQSDVTARVSVLEEQTRELKSGVSDIRSDVKELLRRVR